MYIRFWTGYSWEETSLNPKYGPTQQITGVMRDEYFEGWTLTRITHICPTHTHTHTHTPLYILHTLEGARGQSRGQGVQAYIRPHR